MTAITKAMVLAAGFGSRMRPLTDVLPKPLVRLAGKPLIDHALDRLAAAGVETAVVNVHYLADAIEAHLRFRERPAALISDERDAILDTGGGVKRALGHFGGAAFYIHNSDSVWLEAPGRTELDALAASWRPETMDALLMLAPAHDGGVIGYQGRGDFHLLPDGRLARRAPGEAAAYVFAGVSIAHPRLFEGAPEGPFSLNGLWDRSMAAGRLCGVAMRGLWMHVGDQSALAEAEHRMAAAATSRPVTPP